MIIESVQINGFGCIEGEYEFSKSLNLIVASNESGKTTLADALICLLYGIKQNLNNRRVSVNYYKRYSPIAGENFSLSGVIVTEAGRKINVWRDFINDSFRVLDLISGKDVTAEFSTPPNGDCLGLSLTGLTLSQYRKLAFLSQDELNKDWEFVEFVDALSSIFSSDNGQGATVEEAKAALESSANSFSGVSSKGKVKVETEISRIESRLQEIEAEIFEINAAYSEVEKRFTEAADKKLTGEKFRNDIKKYDYLLCKLHLEDYSKKLQEKRAAREKLAAIEEEICTLSELKECDFADIEQMAELLTLINERKGKLSEIEEAAADLEQEYEYLQVRVDNLGKRSNVSDSVLHEIESHIAVLESHLGREKSIRVDCRSAEGMLAEAGVSSSEVIRFAEWAQGHSKAEVAFVKNYSQICDKVNLDKIELEKEKEKQLNSLSAIASERLYQYRGARNNLILGCVFTAISVCAFFAMGMLWFMLIPAVICIGWAVFGAVKLGRVEGVGRDKEIAIHEYVQNADKKLDILEDKWNKIVAKLSSLAEQLEVTSDELLELIGRFKKADREIESWEHICQRHNSVEEVIEESLGALKNIFCKIGVADSNTVVDATRAKVFLREVSDALGLMQQRQKVEEELLLIKTQRDSLNAELQDISCELKDHFNAAGVILPADDFSTAMDEFREKANMRKRLEYLEDVALADAIEVAGERGSIDSIAVELATWEQRLQKMLLSDKWLQVFQPEMSVFEYENEIKIARLQLEDTEGELVEREKALAIEQSRRRGRLPALADEESMLRLALKKAERFRAATSVAMEHLDLISIQLHARWSPLFSEEYNKYIQRFSSKLEFSLSKDLRLSARLKESGAVIASERLGEHLSKGMRDQVYLSLRLLLAQKVAVNETVPIILDDPFVNADEKRFLEGMEQLLELSEQVQVFVFSCHELRHDELCFGNESFADAVVKI